MNKQIESFREITWAILLLLGLVAWSTACTDSDAEDVLDAELVSSLTDLQAAVATYMYLPQFSFPEFAKQVFKQEVKSAGYDPISRYLYVHVPVEMASSRSFADLTLYPDSVEVAQGYDVIDWLGPNVKRDRDSTRVVVRFPAKHMRLDSSRVLARKLGKFQVSMSLDELANSFRHRYAYNGPALALAPGPGDISYVIANHVAPMSTPGDPVLERVVRDILDHKLETREDTAQKLLDFVTSAITYTHHGDLEIFMRPVDVLLAGEADCSGKVILYGSLLNQVDIPFLVVYLDGHITIGVRGKFSRNNGMFFMHETDTYTLAETTAEGFRIGHSELIEPMETWHYKYLQRPGKTEKLFDLWKNDSLEFADRVDLAGYRAPAVR